MKLVFDTCFLINHPKDAAAWIEKNTNNPRGRFVTDHPAGECAKELIRHSPGSDGDKARRRLADRKKVRQISTAIWRVYLNAIRNEKKRIFVQHRGTPSAELRRELLQFIGDDVHMKEWWRKDKIWVSMAQSAIEQGHSPVYILSSDRGFRRTEEPLKKHKIHILNEPPPD